jgi:hypothetical protein
MTTSVVEVGAVAAHVTTNIAEMVWSCSKNVLIGAWDATAGRVQDAFDCLINLIDCGKSAIQGFNRAMDFFRDIGHNLRQVASDIANLTGQQKADLICEMIGTFAPQIALALITGGSSATTLVALIPTITSKIKAIARVLKRLPGVSHRRLSTLTDDVFNKVEELAGTGYERFVRRALDACPL